MLKTRKKWISILLTLAMLVGLMVPLAAPASAADNYTALTAPNVNDDSVATLGTIFAKFTAGQLKQGDSVIFRLPDNFEFRQALTSKDKMTEAQWNRESVSGNVYYYGIEDVNNIQIPATYSSDTNGLYGAKLDINVLDDNEIQVTITDALNANLSSDDAVFYLNLGAVYVDSGFDGDINVEIDAPANSGFSSASVPVGRVTGGTVSIAVTNVDTFSNDHFVTLRIKEDTAGALSDENESIKLKLPSGFEWGALGDKSKTDSSSIKTLWGDKNLETVLENSDTADGQIVIDKDELSINLPSGFETTKDTAIELTVEVKIADETKAQTGDIVVKTTNSKSDVTPDEFTVGKYGEYNTTIAVSGDVPTIFSGQYEQKISDIVIKEDVEGSLIEGRTLTLTLPSNAKWGKIDIDSDNGVRLTFDGFPGTDGQTAKWTVTGESTDAAELTLSDMEIVVEPGYQGDIVAEVGGTAGLSGELTVAKAITPVSITASAKPVVKVGTISEGGTLTITENKAEAIGDDSGDQIIVDLPQGVRWAATPTVKVTSGDLDIDEGNVKTQKDGEEDDNQLVIPIETSSTEPSTIEISNIKYIVDRTVPEGDIKVKVQGPAVAETKSDTKTEDYFGSNNISSGTVYIDGEEAFDLESGHLFDKTGTAASTFNATVSTPGAGGQTASFVIGSTTYTVNGVEATMDVAAYVKDGRTYLPVRYVAYALGITPENILWDGRTATFIGNGRVVQATPGSSVLTINGAPVTMDVPTENVNGRVMVPFRWVAQAFGAQVNYDDANQTVTMTL